jgi:biotin carboxyl carrier protein
VAAAIAAVAGIAAYQALKAKPAQKAAWEMSSIPTAVVKIGTLERTMRLSGQTSARTFANIAAPLLRGPDSNRALELIFLAKSGTMVKKGEMVAKFDSQAMEDHLDDVADLVATAENDVLQRKAQQAVEWGDMEQTLRLAKSNLDKAKADARAADVRTAIEKELLMLSVSENEANYNQIQKDIPLKRAEHEAETRTLEVTLERQRDHLERHEIDFKRTTVTAPMAGMVVMQAIFRNGAFDQIQKGDMIYPGQPFMKIVQPESMQVEATINQAQSSELRIGQSVRIGLDAFPGFVVNGRIYSIGAMGVGSWRENYYIREIPLRIAIEGGDPRVIPDLSAAADVVLEKADNAVLAPAEAVQSENGKSVVFVKNGPAFEKREVQLGLRNGTQAAVVRGLGGGETVALRKP